MDTNALAKMVGEWSREKFNPNGSMPPIERIAAILNKLSDEIVEFVESQFEDSSELADCIMLLLDIAYIKNVDIEAAILRKLEVIKKREWDEPDENGVVSHKKYMPEIHTCSGCRASFTMLFHNSDPIFEHTCAKCSKAFKYKRHSVTPIKREKK